MNSFIIEFPSICLRALLDGYSTCGIIFQNPGVYGKYGYDWIFMHCSLSLYRCFWCISICILSVRLLRTNCLKTTRFCRLGGNFYWAHCDHIAALPRPDRWPYCYASSSKCENLHIVSMHARCRVIYASQITPTIAFAYSLWEWNERFYGLILSCGVYSDINCSMKAMTAERFIFNVTAEDLVEQRINFGRHCGYNPFHW